MKGSKIKRCGCPEGRQCPRLAERRHGKYGYDYGRLLTTKGVRSLRRVTFDTARERDEQLRLVNDLIGLAAGDKALEARIGDLVWERSKRGGQLPSADDVRRRLGLRRGLDASETFGEAWPAWLRGKRRARPSYARTLEQIGRNWLLPVLADVELDRITGEHCAMVFERIDQFNAEIAAAAAGSRPPVLTGDVRSAAKHVSVATQHRVLAALRAFLNYQWRRAHKIPFNPVHAVELEPEVTPEAERWSAAEARQFIAASAADPLGLMFRVILLRGERRGEAVGFRWSGADLDAGYLTVEKTVLELGGHVVDGSPKTRASARMVWLDDETIALLREHRRAQVADRLRAGEAWQDNDLIFCRADGSPWPPDYVSRRFKRLARAAGLRPIKLHEGRHTAASLGHDAEVDPEIRRRTLGHADQAMTSHYTHPEQAAYRAAANAVAGYVAEAGQ